MSKIRPFQHAPAGGVTFGPGVASNACTQGPLKKCARILIVTDKSVRPLAERITQAIGERRALIDDGVVPDGDVAHIDGLAARAKEAGVDGILAVGGGSVMDTAKGVA